MKLDEILKEAQNPHGALLSDELAVNLAKANVPKEVIDALRVAMVAAGKDTYAATYAHAMTMSWDQFALEGVKHQTMYMVLNLKKWQGEEAREAKKILKKWSSS